MENSISIQKSLERHRINKAIEHLLGLVEGIIADNHLHDKEVHLLSTWLSANPEATSAWPGNLVGRKVQEVLADGIITEVERSHLLKVLSGLIASDFHATGSASAEVTTLPIDDAVTVDLRNSGVCMTGEFIYGTRAACERLTLRAGGMPLDNVSKNVDILVIGTRVSPDWVHTTFGRKIQRAAELQDEGHAIEIISERRWLEVVGS
jgi:NAD-dependent DNA ligase